MVSLQRRSMVPVSTGSITIPSSPRAMRFSKRPFRVAEGLAFSERLRMIVWLQSSIYLLACVHIQYVYIYIYVYIILYALTLYIYVCMYMCVVYNYMIITCI